MATVNEIDDSILEYKGKSVTDYLDEIDQELADIDKTNNKEYYQSNRPSGIVNRIFVDVFGVIGLYLMLFILSDFTRVVLTGGKFFGIKWLFWGPYYYITDAPLLTRVWESKKFLKDLAEVKGDVDFAWPENNSCSQIGDTYKSNCNSESPHNHPVKDKIGDGLDWLIRHTIGKHFGGFLGNGNCTDQSTTIAADCAYDRVRAAWGAYNGFCDIYPTLITHRAMDINWPNTVSMNSGDMSHFSDHDKTAYQMYYDVYTAIYDIGSTVFTGHGTPENLNPSYDTTNYYCYNGEHMWGFDSLYAPSIKFEPVPSWYSQMRGSLPSKDRILLFQNNYDANKFNV